MKTSRHIDWLSVTLQTWVNWRQFIPFVDLIPEGKGRHGYGEAFRDRHTGARIETASNREDMGTHITLSGDVLQAMRDDLGMIDDALVKRIQEYDGKCSRIDLAINVHAGELTPAMLHDDITNGNAKIRARTWRFIEGTRNGIQGDTFDTGAVSSDVRLRFYDKRAEQRIKDGEAWVRLELQLRRLRAKAALTSCITNGVGATVAGSIGHYLTWDNAEYAASLAGDYAQPSTIPRQDSKRKMWLLGQVARALAAELQIDPFFRERFNMAVNHFYDQYRQIDKQNK